MDIDKALESVKKMGLDNVRYVGEENGIIVVNGVNSKGIEVAAYVYTADGNILISPTST